MECKVLRHHNDHQMYKLYQILQAAAARVMWN